MNLETLQWDDELLSCMHAPREMLPEIRPSMGSFGTTMQPGRRNPCVGAHR